MRPRTIVQKGVGVTPAFPVDWRQQNFQVTLVFEVDGTATYTAQVTGDNLIDGATPFWIDYAGGSSSSRVLLIDRPITAFRINQTAGDGIVICRFVQQSGS